jgi:ribosomal protein S18 acetylase RimI-like enzyme
MPPDIRLREVVLADVPEVLRQRQGMFQDMGYRDAAALEAMRVASEEYLLRGIREGFFRGWLAEADGGKVLGGGGVVITAWPAHPRDPQSRRATILNVYTDPEFRRRGIARTLLQTIIAWCQREGFARVTLHASDDGRHLYESLGFEPSNEMRLNLR